MIQRNSNVGTSSIDELASNVAGAHYSNFSPNIGIGNGGNSRANARKANGSAVSGSAALLQPPALTFGGSRTTESNGGKSQYLGSAKLPKFGGSSVSHAGQVSSGVTGPTGGAHQYQNMPKISEFEKKQMQEANVLNFPEARFDFKDIEFPDDMHYKKQQKVINEKYTDALRQNKQSRFPLGVRDDASDVPSEDIFNVHTILDKH